MEDMSPAAPMPQRRDRAALEGSEEWVAGVLEADLGAPRKQRHTARRIYDRLVAERGYGGLCSAARRLVRELRLARAAAGGARLLFQVFADAVETQSVVIITNLEFSRWGSVFGDDQMAAAVIDRIVHHGRLVQFRGESHRVRHALMR
ncbi:ATP-binding protein, partial [Parolsenella catena]|uniref:ATP-binding protein n=1 Tax=Parolsenella catena TaxID=2003188 RepID=UPI003A95B1EF